MSNIRGFRIQHDSLTEKQRIFIDDFSKRYTEKTKKSKNYISSNRYHLCDWMNSLGFKLSLKEMLYPIISHSSEGAYFTDIDGNRYIDIAMGYGVCFHGHKPKFVYDAIKERLERGFELGPQTVESGEAAYLIHHLTGVDRVTFCGTGSEAVMFALRIARGFTRKKKIVIFANSFHGTFDGVLGKMAEDITIPVSPGTTEGMVEDLVVLEYGSDAALDYIRKNADGLAAVMAEPVQTRNPSLRPVEFLKEIRKLADEKGFLLIFDETVTGFRVHYGGIQKLFDIKADIVIYGKALGGGMPIAAVCGRDDVMKIVDGGYYSFGDETYPDPYVIFFAGTYYKHPLSIVATLASLKEIKRNGNHLQEYTNNLTSILVEKLNNLFKQKSVPIVVHSFSSFFRFITVDPYPFVSDPIELEILFLLMILKGVYTWERRICYLSTQHTIQDVEDIVKIVDESIDEMRSGGFSFTF
ncbi:aspartate aminotransferase family protein [Calditerrivibrio nitroreducens]|uniref:Aminotransferase class-III n=1 Tax=Calditerrivibrio nitroreducens (strain DSM 19672 / NBRC 101217 / Yu37-1) TaxID=768670 RepID=E4TH14_CALNY|nr:aminotransferase class III-fold pyridoxal phosphate-dependent enzyme [Calditerrivibrio nitroreducens]ADR19812.1 aminotransferase class-III [Calditerrivibrio nitroreducens DSM 19672]